MKHIAKVVCALLALLMVAACFAACGETASTASVVKIGATGPLTGEYANYGTSVQNGAQLAIEKINKPVAEGGFGGLNGYTFAFDMKDDQGDAEKAQNGFASLYSWGMQASIGSVTSGACVAFAKQAKAKNVFVLTPSASDASVIAVANNIFRVCFGDPQQGEIAATELTRDYTKIGVMYDMSIDYSTGIYEAFVEKMTALGKASGTDYVAVPLAEGTKDFSSAVDTLKTAGCDVIFLPIYYEAAGLVAKAAATAGYNVPIFGADGLDGVAGQIDSTVTAKISYITPFDVNSTDESVSAFVTAYKAKYDEDPDQFAADGYDAIMAIYEAMKKANVTDAGISAKALNDILVATFTSSDFSYTGLTGKNMTWDESGSCEKAPMVVEVKR